MWGYLIPDMIVEAAARSAGYLVRMARNGSELRAEGLVRGFVWGLRMNARKLFVGRGVILEGAERIRLGRNVRLNHAVHVSTGHAGFLHMGADSHLGRQTVVAASGGVRIGRGCAISSHVSIFSVTNVADGERDVEDNDVLFAEVAIGDGVFVGAGVVILPGVVIGDRATIAAGSVVNRNVAAGQTVGGVPARPLVPGNDKKVVDR